MRPTFTEDRDDADPDWFTDQIGEALQGAWGVLVSPIRQDEEAGEGMCTVEVVFEGPTGWEAIGVILALGKVPDDAGKDALRSRAEARLEEMVDYLAHSITVQSFSTVAAFEQHLGDAPAGATN